MWESPLISFSKRLPPEYSSAHIFSPFIPSLSFSVDASRRFYKSEIGLPRVWQEARKHCDRKWKRYPYGARSQLPRPLLPYQFTSQCTLNSHIPYFYAHLRYTLDQCTLKVMVGHTQSPLKLPPSLLHTTFYIVSSYVSFPTSSPTHRVRVLPLRDSELSNFTLPTSQLD